MNKLLFVSVTFIFLGLSCTVPKDARLLKKATKDWRKSAVILWAYGDSPFGSTTLTLRDNYKFELTSSGFFRFWFEAGTWTHKEDTIKLSYVDKELKEIKIANAYISRKKHRLYFGSADTTQMGLKLHVNKIPE